MSANPHTNGGRLVKRGDTVDIECHRTTYRLQKAKRLLAAGGIEATWDHSDRTGLVGTGLLQREGHVCDYRCKAVWPEYVTGAMFDLAYRLADEMQTEKGRFHQRWINERRAAA